jgi:uncharacterized membrane protein YgcG
MTSPPNQSVLAQARFLTWGRGPVPARFAVLGLILLLATPLFARSWRVTDFQDTISISRDGSAAVEERITLAFSGEWHGIHRFIPVDSPGPRGTNYALFLKVTSVTDDRGNPLTDESSLSHGYRDLKIYIPNAADSTRTVVIRYVVRNSIRFFEDHDEFYWNVTGNDWPVPIDRATASIIFPSAAAGSLRAQAFTGVYGSAQQDATSEITGSEARFETTRPLPMRGGLTVDIYIPKGILEEPGAFTRAAWFVGSNPIVLLPFWTLAVMFSLWWRWGRDPDPGLSVAPMYEPPAGISPAEAGTLLADTIHPRDITSTIIDLAVRGLVKIEQTEEPGLIFNHRDCILHLLVPRENWQNLQPHERVMLENIFAGDSPQTRLSDLKNRFYTAVPVIRQDIMAELRNKGMYLLDPESANSYSFVAILVIVAPFLLLQFLWHQDVFASLGLVILSAVISAVIWWLFARQMTAKTLKGVQTRIAVLGFQEFMNRVEADQLKRMPSDTFEKYLPYAMALGVEHHWARAFAGIVQDPPRWYVGPAAYAYGAGFNPILFSNSIDGLASNMHQVFVSAPRASSTGSGWTGGGSASGGGFSGGGFGGGGGGAF